MSIPLWDLTAGTATDLLAGLRARGVVLWLEDGRLRWRAPRGAMTVPLLTRVKILERDLVALLAVEPSPDRGNEGRDAADRVMNRTGTGVPE